MNDRRTQTQQSSGGRHFPHQLAWLIDNPLRRLVVTPKRLANRVSLKPTDEVLDIGPGSGYFSVELARRIPRGRLELLDVQTEMLAKAQRRIEAAGLENAGYTVSDAGRELPFPDASFDVALLVCVLGEIGDAKSCLREINRVLRQNGRLVIHEHVPDPDRIPFSTLQPMVEQEGFRFERRWGMGWNYTAVFRRND